MATAAAARAHRPLRRMEGVGFKSALRAASPRAPALAAAALLVPLGAALLVSAGAVLLATLAGLALAAPPLVIFSPVLAPAAAAAVMAVAGLLAAGALGVAGVSALAWTVGYIRRGGARGGGGGGVAGMIVQPLDDVGKRHGAGGAAFVGHRLRDAGDDDAARGKAQEATRA
uniref:Oleosin n=1 Tax=Oryza punctata TaxID=4537 RepID=A0A0E0LBK1_ORYPU